MIRVVWVRADNAFPGWRRNWFPVYWPPHRDPEISPQAALPHCHIAWNRIARRPRLLGQEYRPERLAGYPVWVRAIKEIDFKKPSPIIGPPASYRLPAWEIQRIWGKKFNHVRTT